MSATPLHMSPAQLHDYLSRARWFGGKGREFEVKEQRSVPLTESTWIELIEVSYPTGDQECFQLPLVAYDWPQDRLSHALIEFVDGHAIYDAVHDREAMAVWLKGFAQRTRNGGLEFHLIGEPDLDLTAHSTLFQGEQSNSSVTFGESSQLKVFRKVTPGVNPDVEILEALTTADCPHIAALYGWVSLRDGDDTIHLAILQEFIRTATEGWQVALASVRDLLAEGDLHPDEVGGDFAGEAHRLGMSICEIHLTMRNEMGEWTTDGTSLATSMLARLDSAITAQPLIAEFRDQLSEMFNRMQDIEEPIVTQRIHGDLHLGQTLRDTMAWKVVDFEGEPAKPLAHRQLPDSPWRDVAGMLRSFDYAARAAADDVDPMGNAATQAQYRAAEWRARNQAAFLAGYTESLGRELTPWEDTLLEAYAADKTIYEAVYETRNRPDWLHIPLDALRRISTGQIREQHFDNPG